MLHAFMPEDFPKRCAFTPTDHEDPPRIGMAQEGRMDERFMVDEFVRLGRLHLAVKNETAPVTVGLKDFHFLIFRLLGKENVLNSMNVPLFGAQKIKKPFGALWLGHL